MGADEAATLDALIARRKILGGLIATHRGRMAASPPDSTIPYFTAAFFIHDKDPRGDVRPYFWGWSFSSRGPAMAWIDAAALNVEGLLPDDPPTGSCK